MFYLILKSKKTDNLYTMLLEIYSLYVLIFLSVKILRVSFYRIEVLYSSIKVA